MTDKPQQMGEGGRLGPRIVVVGVGGAGGNAVNNMIQSKLVGVDFLIANTDAQALGMSLCEQRIQIGRDLTQGLGAGSRPDIGREAAEEALHEIREAIDGANMLFITAGMGGGTGTGAAPIVARVAREAGILTVGVVTKPFHFEGRRRMSLADVGIEDLADHVDTLIVIPNQNLFRIANEKTTFADAFRMADDVLHSGVRGVTDLMVTPGLINLDFADVRAVMTEMGKAMMGTGEAEGENRALSAAEAAIANPLLDEISMKGARGVLINITGGMDLTLFEIDQAANRIRDEVDSDANIIFGSTLDENLQGRMRVSVVAAGIDAGPVVRGDTGSKRPIVSLFADRTATPPKGEEEPRKPPSSVAAPREPEARPEAEAEDEAGHPPSEETDGGGQDAPLRASAPVFPFRARPKDRKGGEPLAGPDRALKTSPGAGQAGSLHSVSPKSLLEEDLDFGVESEVASEESEAAPGTDPEEQPIGASPAHDAAAQPEADAGGAPETEPAARPVSDGTAARGEPDEVRTTLRDSETDIAVPRRRRPGGFFSWISGTGADNADELFRKADRLYHGQGERRNLPLAFRTYMRAAETGHPGAQNRVGWMYEKGEGVEADHGEAVRWYRKAAEQGYVNAMNDLGYMYRQGWGVPQSYEDALFWFGKAADKYDSYAEYNMGQMYENGLGVDKDLDEAIRWFRRSAARGHEWAAKRLEELGIKT